MRLASNIAFLSVTRLATLVSSALLSVVTARSLGPVGRGLYSLPAIDASVAVTFSVGLSSAASYFLLNRKAGSQLSRALSYALIVFMLVGFAATLLLAALSHSLWALPAALAFTVGYAVYSIVCGYYLGRNRVLTAGLFGGTLSIVTLAFVSAALLLTRRSPQTALIAWILAIGVVASAGLIFVVIDCRKLVGEPVDTFAAIRFGARAGLLNVANLLNYRVDIFVVAMLLPVATVGLYTIAVACAESALSLTLAVGQATLPRVGSLERHEAGTFVARCLRNTLFLAAVLCTIGLFATPPIVRLMFGPEYASIVGPVRVLLAGIVAASTGSIVSNYFVLNLGRTRAPLMVSLFSSLLCAGLSFALIPHLGMLGAALASTFAYAISQLLAIVYFCKVSGVAFGRAILVDRCDFSFYGRIARRAVRMS